MTRLSRREQSWSLNEYVTWLYGELRSWRRVYWRLWADCHFLRCQLCDSYFPAYQVCCLRPQRSAFADYIIDFGIHYENCNYE